MTIVYALHVSPSGSERSEAVEQLAETHVAGWWVVEPPDRPRTPRPRVSGVLSAVPTTMSVVRRACRSDPLPIHAFTIDVNENRVALVDLITLCFDDNDEGDAYVVLIANDQLGDPVSVTVTRFKPELISHPTYE